MTGVQRWTCWRRWDPAKCCWRIAAMTQTICAPLAGAGRGGQHQADAGPQEDPGLRADTLSQAQCRGTVLQQAQTLPGSRHPLRQDRRQFPRLCPPRRYPHHTPRVRGGDLGASIVSGAGPRRATSFTSILGAAARSSGNPRSAIRTRRIFFCRLRRGRQEAQGRCT